MPTAGHRSPHVRFSLRPAPTLGFAVSALPNVPTMAESGYPGHEVDFWNGLFAPAKTPDVIVSRLAAWFADAMKSPNIETNLAAQGFYPHALCGADFAALLRAQHQQFGRVIREANITNE